MYINNKRSMAWITRIDEVKSIENADQICAYRVGGWWVVDKKQAYKPGDVVVYISIDSWIPHQLAPFLSKGAEPREYRGIKGERLRTIKLRGQISQGLLLPMKHLTNYGADLCEGSDVSEQLRIQKYEPPIPAQLAGEVIGMFPSFIPKTDQERVQNLTAEVARWTVEQRTFEVTEKLDGSSMTVYVNNGVHGVCSRNLDLKQTQSNTFWKVCVESKVHDAIAATGRNLAVQGELIGEGIQRNLYKLIGHAFYVFDVYDIDNGVYLTPDERRQFCSAAGLNHVPVLVGCGDKDLGEGSVDNILEWAEGKSVLCQTTEREGIVFKCNQDPSISFKAISNRFLIKGEM